MLRFATSSFHCLHELDQQMQPSDERAAIKNCKISRLLFAADLFLVSATECGLQGTWNSLAETCDSAWMKIYKIGVFPVLGINSLIRL